MLIVLAGDAGSCEPMGCDPVGSDQKDVLADVVPTVVKEVLADVMPVVVNEVFTVVLATGLCAVSTGVARGGSDREDVALLVDTLGALADALGAALIVTALVDFGTLPAGLLMLVDDGIGPKVLNAVTVDAVGDMLFKVVDLLLGGAATARADGARVVSNNDLEDLTAETSPNDLLTSPLGSVVLCCRGSARSLEIEGSFGYTTMPTSTGGACLTARLGDCGSGIV